MFASSELVLIRHAAAENEGRLAGRRDVGLADGAAAALAALAGVLPDVQDLRISPAFRCRLTAEALWPEAAMVEDARLWEQDFGDWEGQRFDAIPDAGPLSRAQLLDLAPPNGESFRDLCARVTPPLLEAAEAARAGGPVVLVVHAGVARAALSLALANLGAGLAFEVDPLSVTRLRCLADGGFSVAAVNWSPA